MLRSTLLCAALILSAGLTRAEDNKNAIQKGYVLSIITVTTSKDEADKFVKTFQESPKSSHKMAGFIGFAVAENVKDSGSFVVISIWKDEASLNDYVKSEGFRADHANMGKVETAKTGVPGRFIVKEN
jgi:heme-degrading monooxygenase HmoA